MARASFTTLPLELKARVVEMTNNQEDAWDLRARDDAGHINCLSALALVNKELRSLAAEHQFKVLSAKRAALPIFRYHVLPFYGNHIHEIQVYDDASVEGSDNALLAVGHLPALDTLRLQSGKALELFGSFQNTDPSDDITTYRARMLAITSTKITTLVLYGFDPAEASAVVRRFPNVTTLGLHMLQNPGSAGDITGLFGAITFAARISSLTIQVASGFGDDWPADALATFERDPPPIKTLQLLYFPFDDRTLRIVALLASTIEKFTLQGLELEQPLSLDSESITPLRLPRLTHLNLCIHGSYLPHLAHLFTSSSTLSHLSLLYTDAIVDSTNPSLLSFLDSQSTLRHVHLEDLTRYHPFAPLGGIQTAMPSLLAAYSNLVHSRGLNPSVLDKPHLTPFHRAANLDYTQSEGLYLAEVLDRTLDFGRSELKRMVAEGRAASAVEWVEGLRSLEDKRLAWKD